MKLICVMGLVFWSFVSFAVEPMAPLQMQVMQGDRLEVVGYVGSVELVPVSGNIMSVELDKKHSLLNSKLFNDDWNFTLNKRDGVISVKVIGPHSKAKWNEMMLSQNLPPFHLIIKSPALPVEVNWQKGNLSAKDWKHNLYITSIDGTIAVHGGEGELNLNLQKGSIAIAAHKGAIEIDGYNPEVEIKKVNGDINVVNFMGKTNINNIEGRLNLDSHSGHTQVAEVKGSVNFKNGQSPLKISKVDGSINGRSGQGAVYLTLSDKANVRVKTEEGLVSLNTIQSGAWVNLGSNEGSLHVPNFLKLTQYPSLKIRRGRLKGSKGGRIFVRTRSGDIRLR